MMTRKDRLIPILDRKQLLKPYSITTTAPWVQIPLDRTEPPFPYRTAISLPGSSNKYPVSDTLALQIAEQLGRKPDDVIITAGADEALDRICRAFLTNHAQAIITSPTFEMIRHYTALANAEINEVPWFDGAFPFNDIVSGITERTRLLILASPNNPTGQVIPVEAIGAIALQFPTLIVVVDLAYIEFAKSDPTEALLAFKNIIVVRSFSKAWGLPGLRVGYAVGNRAMIDALKTAGGPYSVSQPSIEFIAANLEHLRPSMLEYVQRIQFERNELQSLLAALAIDFLPSESNFILARPQRPAIFDRALRSFGVATRSFDSSDLKKTRRITLPGNTEAFRLLRHALTQAAFAMRNEIIPIH